MKAKPKNQSPAVKQDKTPPPNTEVVESSTAAAMFSTEGTALDDFNAGTDTKLSMLKIIQANSPQLKRDDTQYIKGAEQGDIAVTILNQHYKGDEGVVIVPFAYRKQYVEWTDEAAGQAQIVATHAVLPDNTRRGENGRIFREDNVINPTALYGILVINDEGDVVPALLYMARSQLKQSVRWNTLIANLRLTNAAGERFCPPIYAGAWRITTVPEKNDQGSWFSWKPDFERWISDLPQANDLHAQATQYRRHFMDDKLRADEGDNGDVATTGGSSTDDAPM